MIDYLCETLISNGFKCYMNKSRLTYDDQFYNTNVLHAIHNSRLILCCLSSSYLNSDYSKKEFHYAYWYKSENIIPILLCKETQFDCIKEFGAWPSEHEIFLMLSNKVWIQDLYESLVNKELNVKNNSLKRLIKQIKLQIHDE
jgi:hypothetical protein